MNKWWTNSLANSFTEPRFKREQFSSCKIFHVKTSLCVTGLCGCDSIKIYTGKVMGEVYFPAWFQNRAAGEITQVQQYTTVFWAEKSPTSIKNHSISLVTMHFHSVPSSACMEQHHGFLQVCLYLDAFWQWSPFVLFYSVVGVTVQIYFTHSKWCYFYDKFS